MGLILTAGPLTLDFGDIDSSSTDETEDDPANADTGDDVDGTGMNDDEATGPETPMKPDD